MTAKPALAMFSRHSLLDGRGAGFAMPPGTDKGHPFLGPWPHNIGDQFVAAGLARALDMDRFYTLTREASAAQFDFINNECAAVIVIGQNVLFPGWFSKYLPVSYLKQLKIPLIFLSLGLQFGFKDTLELTPSDVESLKWIHDRCASSQIRGHITEELLARYGVKNTRVLGCPSLLYPMTDKIKIRPPSLERVCFTVTDMRHLPDNQQWQIAVMENLLERSERFSAVAQGGEYVLQDHIVRRDGVSPIEREDFYVAVADDGAAKINKKEDFTGPLKPGDLMLSKTTWEDPAATESAIRYYYKECSEALLENLIHHSFYGGHLSEYVRKGRDASFYAGTRLHGNLIALMQGTPSVFAVHDYRLKDMAEFLDVPSITMERNETHIDLAALSWKNFEDKFSAIVAGFKSFFEENGLHHRL